MKGQIILAAFLLAGILHSGAQDVPSERARAIAEDFLRSQREMKKVSSKSDMLEGTYSSADTAANRVFVFSDPSGGFVLVSDNGGYPSVKGYSLTGSFPSGELPPAVSSLLKTYEQDAIPAETGAETPGKTALEGIKGAEVVVEPLLYSRGVNMNQYWHEEAGGCPTGCAATAMAQIMAYYRYPSSGEGSVCYTHPVYGEQCADFGNTVYNWEEMTDNDSRLLSYHVAVAMSMNFCGDASGSIPSDPDYTYALQKYFRYHMHSGSNESYYIANELDHERPVYCELPGDPGHSVVIDGYDSEGFFHVNFGWGGNYNGFYMLNNSTTFFAGYTFGTNLQTTRFISPEMFVTDTNDSLALVAFYESMDGSVDWDLTKPVVNWPGVTVMNGRVTGIRITHYYMQGTIPEELGDLTELRRLNIRGRFQGPLPASLTGLTRLTELEIRGTENSVKGPMPEDIGNLGGLHTLHLPFILNGTIPASIGNLIELRSLNLSVGELEGDIPVELYNLTLLESLMLHRNNLTGNIDPAIGNLTGLKYLSLWRNNLSGPIPEEIGNLINLREFSIAENGFSGQLPETIGGWNDIREFRVAGNQLEGAVPDAITSFSKLTDLRLNNNQFTTLPENIGNLELLKVLEAQNNLLETIPASISQLTDMYQLTLNNNRISHIPDMGAMPALWNFNLSYNQLESLPESFGNLTRVSYLYLGHNLLTELPSSFENLSTIRMLGLNANRLTSAPVSLCFLGNLRELFLFDNEIAGPLPPLSHLGITYMDIRRNRLVFSDIASSLMPDDTIYTDNYVFMYHEQARVELTDSVFYFEEGDSAAIDIRNYTRLSHSANQYEWYRDEEMVMEGPVLSFPAFTKGDEGKYTCRVRNSRYSKLLVLESGPVTLRAGSDGREDEGYVVSSRSSATNEFSDNYITLAPPAGIRGDVTWQASVDSIGWTDVSDDMDHPEISESILSVNDNRILTEPKTPLLFRYLVHEGTCDPLVSDTVRLMPYGTMLVDTMLNVSVSDAVVSADSIEIVIPAGLSDKDFRLTVSKVDNPPAAPDTMLMGSVYDVRLSLGTVFDIPLLIRLKNIDKATFDEADIDRYRVAYYDDMAQEWVLYDDNAGISLKDTTIVFKTDHLTKLSWLWDTEVMWGYTDVFVKNNIRVFYKESDLDRFDLLYGKNQTTQPWHVEQSHPEYGTPLMIQDVAHFLYEVMDKFRELELKVPDHNFSVFVKEMDDYGTVGLMGMLNHYININRDIENPETLRSLIAHEFMHYTQDHYIRAHAGNTFWMEAHAHLSDRMVWDTLVLPVSESEGYLLNGRSGRYNMFGFLSNSWDYWDKSILTHNARGNVYYCYMAGTFLHYLRSYKEGARLQPDLLLKETSLTGSWLNYLDSYIRNHLSSNIGDQYEDFVKYIVEGSNPRFGFVSHAEGEDPLRYFRAAPDEFMTTKLWRFSPESAGKPVKDSLQAALPYLSAQMAQLYNLNTDNRKIVARYKRKHEGHENIRVYLARYDAESRKMVMEDISDRDSSFFVIDPATSENLEARKHIAYLLFINKDKSQSFNIDYSIELLPVPDFRHFNGLGFTIGQYSTQEALIHIFTDGTTETTDQFWIMPGVFRIFEEYHSPLSFTVEITDSTIITTATSLEVDQHVTYNFITGSMVIYEREDWGGSGENTKIDIREMKLELNNVWLKPVSGSTQSRFSFTTDNTAHTLEVVESIEYTRKLALWNTEEQQHDPIVTTTYLRTDYEVSDEIRFRLSFW